MLLRSLGRSLTVLLLIAGMGMLGPASAAQIFCPPDCEMHQPAAATPSCCETPDMAHGASGSAGHGGPPDASPAACCGGELCVDASTSTPEFSAALPALESAGLTPPDLPYQAAALLSAVPVTSAFVANVKSPPIPIYLRTCAFLI